MCCLLDNTFSFVEIKPFRLHFKHDSIGQNMLPKHIERLTRYVIQKKDKVFLDRFNIIFDGRTPSSVHYDSTFFTCTGAFFCITFSCCFETGSATIIVPVHVCGLSIYSPTPNLYQRLIFTAWYTLSNCRKYALPANIKMHLFLHVDKRLWDISGPP